MPYDFDEIIQRRGTSCIKYDFAKERGMPEDVLPLWVADMDFRTPPEVADALRQAAEHGIFGYSESKDEYFAPLRDWFSRRLGWTPEKAWLKKTPGVVYAINAAVRAFTRRGEAVIIQSPVYYPFFSSVRANGRLLVDSPLVRRDGAYSIDFADFERKVKEFRPRLFLLCSPHNPVGRVWTADELDRLGGICLKHGTLILADEIHCDFVWGGRRHLVFGSWSDELAEQTVLATAPSKTFNLAGLMISNVFIRNRVLRQEFVREVDRSGISQLGVMGLVAGRAAYEHGEPWLEELKAYLERSLAFAKKFVSEKLPGARLTELEGTYLLWLDFRGLGLSHEEVNDRIVHKAKLWLDDGLIFGEAGRHFQRINMAAPLQILRTALERIEAEFFA
ncbi:MAG: pyridoxal phosphate-dependent aminotransferase [Deltaproteobacteria bacterium]|jgi:cystathionine beta-lyase|nr:pyridoxal phosphate-dependent aminotransferase [Deltaproteobacteria bacterium]